MIKSTATKEIIKTKIYDNNLLRLKLGFLAFFILFFILFLDNIFSSSKTLVFIGISVDSSLYSTSLSLESVGEVLIANPASERDLSAAGLATDKFEVAEPGSSN